MSMIIILLSDQLAAYRIAALMVIFEQLRKRHLPQPGAWMIVVARLRSFISSVILPSSLSYVPCILLY